MIVGTFKQWTAAPRVPGWLLLLAIPLLVAVRGFPALWAPLMSPDEALLIVYPDRVREGAIPNRDFLTVSGAVVNYVHAFVYSIFGTSYIVERCIGLAYHAAICLGVMLLIRRTGQGAAILGAILSLAILEGVGDGAYAYLGGLAFVVLSAAAFISDRPRALFLGGFLGALSTGWRYELLVPVILAAIPYLYDRKRIAFTITGGLCGSVPTLVHLVAAGHETIENILIERASLNFQVADKMVGPEVWAGVLMCVATPIFVALAARQLRERYLWSSAGLCLGIMPQLLQRIDSVHLAYVSCVVLPVLLSTCMRYVDQLARGTRVNSAMLDRVSLIICIPFVLLLASSGIVGAVTTPPPVLVKHAGRALPVWNDEFATELRSTLSDVDEVSGACSNVFSGSTDMSRPTANFLSANILLHRHPQKAYFLELLPGVAERAGSGLRNDIIAADVLVLTHISRTETSLLYPNLPNGSREANLAVADNFSLLSRHGPFEVYITNSGQTAPCPKRQSNLGVGR